MWIKKRDEFGYSGCDQLNFLWKDDVRPVYVMDNHLGALWCWLRELRPNESYVLVHVDHHWDAMQMDDACIETLKHTDLDVIDNYLGLRSPTDAEFPLVRWDNYIDPLPFLRRAYKRMYFHALQNEPQSKASSEQTF